MATPSAALLTSRKTAMEDLAVTLQPNGDTFVDEVAGVGPGQVLTKIPLTLLTQLVSAANDAAAGVAGVNVGEVYFLNTTNKLRTRMS
jgi:hypothetical protein